MLLSLAVASDSVEPGPGTDFLQSTLGRVGQQMRALEARLSSATEENRRLRRLLQQGDPIAPGGSNTMQTSVSVLGATSRQLSESSCCRWTPDESCSSTTQQCTSLHEFLERKTTTVEFADVDQCLGSDQADWSWEFDGSVANSTAGGRQGAVTLSSGGSVRATEPTPLAVVHDSNCAQTLNLQLDTVALGTLTVGGIDVGATLLALTSPPSPSPPPPYQNDGPF